MIKQSGAAISPKSKLKQKLMRWWRSIRYHRYYIIADSNDNSITFSRKLYKHIELSYNCQDAAKIYVFRVPALGGTYAFTVNPDLNNTQLADIQYNEKYKTIGFESLCPSVNLIFNDYGLPFGLKTKLTVTVRRINDGKIFYNIERP